MSDFNTYVIERELMLNEDFSALVRLAGNAAAKAMTKAQAVLAGLQYEKAESQEMMRTFFTMLKDRLKNVQTVTDEDVRDAITQLKNVGKLAAIAPIFMLPGGGTTTAIMYMLGKKFFGISILPRGLEQVFEAVENIQECLIECKNVVDGNVLNL